MAALTGEQLTLLAIIIVICAVTMYFELKMRKVGIGKKYVSSRVKKDQAYNALHTTRAVRNRLKTDRIDTAKADYIIQRAESALNTGDSDSCIDLCQRAREELLKSKREGNVVASSDELDEGEEIAPRKTQAAASVSRKVRADSKSVDSLQLQAKFNLKVAMDNMDTFSGETGERQRAAQFIEGSQRHFDTGEFQKSLSDSFKARKILSGEPLEDNVGETKTPMPEEEGAEKEMTMLEKPVEEDWQPSAPVKGTCKKCGTAYDADDVFCHYCGSPLRAMKCPHCGAELKGIEKFCRKCGKRVNA
jgi:hypothetical protein